MFIVFLLLFIIMQYIFYLCLYLRFLWYHNACTLFCIQQFNWPNFIMISVTFLYFFVFLSSSLQVISNHTRSSYFNVNHCCTLTYAKQSPIVSMHYQNCTWIFILGGLSPRGIWYSSCVCVCVCVCVTLFCQYLNKY